MNETRVKNVGGTIISITIVLSIGYAILRYHIAGDVPWKDFSLFILNKGLCLGAFILITLNFALGPANNLGVPVPESWLLLGSSSLAIFSTFLVGSSEIGVFQKNVKAGKLGNRGILATSWIAVGIVEA